MTILFFDIEVPTELEATYEPILGGDPDRNLLRFPNIGMGDNAFAFEPKATSDGQDQSKVFYGVNSNYIQPFQMVRRLSYSGGQVFPQAYYDCLADLVEYNNEANQINLFDYVNLEKGDNTFATRSGVITNLKYESRYVAEGRFVTLEFTFEDMTIRGY